MNERYKYIDLAKAMAIFFVVLGHTIELTKADATLVGRVDLIAYTLHVPTFLFASGYLLQKSVERYKLKQFFLMKFLNLFIVWIVWSIILTVWNIGIDYVFGQYTGNIYGYINYSVNEIWYLAFLFVGSIFVFVAENIKINKKIYTTGLLLMFVVLSFYSASLAKVVLHLLLIWIGYNFQGFTKIKARVAIVLYLIVMLIVCFSGCLTLESINLLGMGTMGLLSIKLVSCFCIPAIAYLLTETDVGMVKGNVVLELGKNSLYIYILHFLPLAIYKCVGNSSVVVALISVCLFIAVSLVVRYVIKGTKYDKILFRPYQKR